MMPIRKGDGTGLSVPGFSEVRKGDGSVVWSKGPDIPDSGLDHFYWSQELSSVDSWPDEEGGLDASPVGDPQLNPSGINGEQTVDYDGTGDEHITSDTASLGTNGEYTIAGVFQSDVTGERQTAYEVGDGSSIGIRLGNLDSTYYVTHRGIAAYGGGSLDTNPHVLVATFDGSNVIADIDGSEIINTSASAPNSPSNQMSIGSRGGSEYMDGSIGAFGVEASPADATRRDELTDKLAEPYGITVST